MPTGSLRKPGALAVCSKQAASLGSQLRPTVLSGLGSVKQTDCTGTSGTVSGGAIQVPSVPPTEYRKWQWTRHLWMTKDASGSSVTAQTRRTTTRNMWQLLNHKPVPCREVPSRPKCQCRCGCRRRPGRRIRCGQCGQCIGPGCCTHTVSSHEVLCCICYEQPEPEPEDNIQFCPWCGSRGRLACWCESCFVQICERCCRPNDWGEGVLCDVCWDPWRDNLSLCMGSGAHRQGVRPPQGYDHGHSSLFTCEVRC